MAPPKFDIETMGGLVIPVPENKREDIQQRSIRDAQIPPGDYYPKGYEPELIEEWPTTRPVFIPQRQGAIRIVTASPQAKRLKRR